MASICNDMAIEAGQRVGDYEVLAELGAGGLGVVYEVRHLISNRREALKILLPGQSGTPDMAERFRREVQTLATLNHPNIAALHNAFYYENQLVMAMELIHGKTLRDAGLRQRMSLAWAVEIGIQILRALVYAHGLGVVHRDIKPSNIMITDDGVVKLLDFGIAITERSSDLTHAGYLLGSLNYMSPEQVSGSKATARSDLYSVGVTLYELLTGRLPITGATNYEIMMAHVHQTPHPPSEIAPLVPLPLSNLIMRALAKDPSHRFQDASEFLAALQICATPEEHQRMHTVSLPAPAFTPRAGGTGGTVGIRAANVSQSAPFQRPPSSSGFQNVNLEEVSRNLAVYIGPVAKFVVKKLAAQTDDLDVIYREAAKQIPSDSDRAAFMRSRKR
jgi:serine/threonine protein kinase